MANTIGTILLVLVLALGIPFILISRNRVKLKLQKKQAVPELNKKVTEVNPEPVLEDKPSVKELLLQEMDVVKKQYIFLHLREHLIRLFGARHTAPIIILSTKLIDKEISGEEFCKAIEQLGIEHEQPTDVISQTLLKAIRRLEKFYQADIAGVKYFEHVGLSRTSDPEICQKRMGKTYPLGKIEKMQAGEVGPSKIFGCGWGSNCYWEPDPFR